MQGNAQHAERGSDRVLCDRAKGWKSLALPEWALWTSGMENDTSVPSQWRQWVRRSESSALAHLSAMLLGQAWACLSQVFSLYGSYKVGCSCLSGPTDGGWYFCGLGQSGHTLRAFSLCAFWYHCHSYDGIHLWSPKSPHLFMLYIH